MLGLDERDVLSNVARRLPILARRHRVPGAQIAICTNGGIEAVEIGETRFRSGERVTADTAFPIGSITKAFTATAALMLVADGDVELDEPLGDTVTELDPVTGELTLRQVLSHTAGLAAGPESEDIGGATLSRYVRDHVRRHNLLLPAGAAFSYSNMGYVLTGRLIETITGMGWSEAVSAIVAQPLGIEPAFICGHDAPPSGRSVASGHSVNLALGRTRPVRQSMSPAEAPAGGLALSARDLVAFGRTQLDRGGAELLPAEWSARMRTAVPGVEPFGLADGWGLGLAVFEGGARTRWVGHDGNADGTACYLRVEPAGGWIVAMTCNAGTGLALWRDLLGELDAAGVPVLEPDGWSPSAPVVPAPSGCAGGYVNGGFEYAAVERKDGLYLLVDDAAPARLTFHRDSRGAVFSLRDPSSGEPVFGGRFLRDGGTGRVTALQMGGRLARRQMYASHSGRRDLTA